MKHRIEINELCQSNHISKEHAELIIKEIQNALDLYLEVILSFKGITGISLETSSIIRNYIFDNKLEKSIYIINMTRYVRQVFFHNSKTSKETNEKVIYTAADFIEFVIDNAKKKMCSFYLEHEFKKLDTIEKLKECIDILGLYEFKDVTNEFIRKVEK